MRAEKSGITDVTGKCASLG